MIPRYQTKALEMLWSDANKYRTWFEVEVAYLACYLVHQKEGDEALIGRLKAKTNQIDWALFAKRVDHFDAEVRHDMIAFLHALEEILKKDSNLIHIGLTSSDVVDTSFALLLKSAGQEILFELKALIDAFWSKANEFRGQRCLGRTHGQPAEPTTFGIKLLGHMCEFVRAHSRLRNAITDISVGKLSGAVGVYSHTSPTVEKMALLSLGLIPETVSTQVVSRDRHASFFTDLGVLAGSIERVAVEIRLLMHGQVKEAFEPFFSKQKGSSAMPHKKNPVLSENLTGLSRLIRSYSVAAMENQALWHERDISHSCVERVIAPDATGLIHFALQRLCGLIQGLTIDPVRMKENLADVESTLCSQAVMLSLVKKGLMRQEAYEIVQQAALSCKGNDFAGGLADAGINKYLSQDELENCLRPSNVVKKEDFIFDRAELIKSGI